MLKKSNIAAAILLSGVLGGVVAQGISHFSHAEAAKPASPFSPIQEARIGKVAADYLIAHPEVLIKVSEALQARQEAAAVKAMTEGVLAYQSELLHDPHAPSYGPADAKVVVTLFFDYQCVYCSHLAPELTKLMKANPQVRFVFREWPIFGDRWPASRLAAETGLKIWQQKGAEAYLAYHNELYATGHNEGALTENDIRTAAGAMKIAPSAIAKDRDVQAELTLTGQLATDIGLTGTPGLVVMPAIGATAETITVIPGMTDQAVLQMVINKAAGLTDPVKK
ncbi:DsbA family protein [Cedecea sp. NFIX57]|uniref:DsbA family protein n=1 Tax=Cedecea sp. NFIX57 TaxID=1566286 RepID=UPI000A0EC7CD|nr:DsbA family protein [Cedecea sp. NFIX57]SMG61976.1 Protein-disulfide isomerase [Cedecea sp. NFIX57]